MCRGNVRRDAHVIAAQGSMLAMRIHDYPHLFSSRIADTEIKEQNLVPRRMYYWQLTVIDAPRQAEAELDLAPIHA